MSGARAVVVTGLSLEQAEAAVRVAGAPAVLTAALPTALAVLDAVPPAAAVAAVVSRLVPSGTVAVLWAEDGGGDGGGGGHGAAAGIVVARRGRLVAGLEWPPSPGPDDGPETDGAAVLAQLLDAPESTVALRALGRRPGEPRLRVADAAALLHLPADAVAVLLHGPPEDCVQVAALDPRERRRQARRAVRLVPPQGAAALVVRYGWLPPAGMTAWLLAQSGRAALAVGEHTDDVVGFGVLASVTAVATALRVRRAWRQG